MAVRRFSCTGVREHVVDLGSAESQVYVGGISKSSRKASFVTPNNLLKGIVLMFSEDDNLEKSFSGLLFVERFLGIVMAWWIKLINGMYRTLKLRSRGCRTLLGLHVFIVLYARMSIEVGNGLASWVYGLPLSELIFDLACIGIWAKKCR